VATGPAPTLAAAELTVAVALRGLASGLAGRAPPRPAGGVPGRPLDAEAANRAAASLALLDTSGDDPVELRLCDVDTDLDIALTLVDTLDLMGVPVHATCLGEVVGPAIAILAVADYRTAARHATLHLREPRPRWSGHAGDIATHAEHHQRRLRLLQERIARACRRSVDAVAADMRTGRILTAEEAHGYGLVDAVAAGPSRLHR